MLYQTWTKLPSASIKLVIHYLVSFTIDPGYTWSTYFNIKFPVDLTRPLVVLLHYARNKLTALIMLDNLFTAN